LNTVVRILFCHKSFEQKPEVMEQAMQITGNRSNPKKTFGWSMFAVLETVQRSMWLHQSEECKR
jgi:hypothetical protein